MPGIKKEDIKAEVKDGESVNQDEVKASFENGILKLTVPKRTNTNSPKAIVIYRLIKA